MFKFQKEILTNDRERFTITQIFDRIAFLLVNSFVNEQRRTNLDKLRLIGASNRKLFYFLNVLSQIQQNDLKLIGLKQRASITGNIEESSQFIIMMPLLHHYHHHNHNNHTNTNNDNDNKGSNSELDYLIDMTKQDPILLSISIVIRNNLNVNTHFSDFNSDDMSISFADVSVTFPSNMPCSQRLESLSDASKNGQDGRDIPISIDGDENEFNIINVIEREEKRLVNTWLKRKLFVEEIIGIATIIEYDPIDFSFISFAVRLKKGRLFSLCICECKFYNPLLLLPLVSIHDFQNTFSFPLDNLQEKIAYSSSMTPSQLANDLFVCVCKVISNQSF